MHLLSLRLNSKILLIYNSRKTYGLTIRCFYYLEIFSTNKTRATENLQHASFYYIEILSTNKTVKRPPLVKSNRFYYIEVLSTNKTPIEHIEATASFTI